MFEPVAVIDRIFRRGGMMGLAWSERLSVGNAMIDSEHKKLLGMINDVEHAIRARDGAALLQAFKLLEDCVCVHFVNEEKIARAVNFPFVQNMPEHQYVRKEFQHMRDELVGKNGIWSESAAEYYSHFLSEWMIEHILDEDMQMKPVLQNFPYDFKPADTGT
jgi:hemerythrin-like metal-binding protein